MFRSNLIPKRVLTALLGLLGLWLPGALGAQNTEMGFPLVWRGQYLGEIEALIGSPDNTVLGVHRRLAELLAPWAQLEALPEAESPYLSLESWQALGVTLILNWDTLALELELSLEAERARDLPLGRDDSPEPGQVAGASWTAFVNLLGQAEHGWNQNRPEVHSWPLHLTLQGSLEAYGWRLWSELRGETTPETAVSLQALRLSTDFPAAELTFQAGTLIPRQEGLVQSPALYGLSLERFLPQENDRQARSLGRYRLRLERPQIAVIRQNGQEIDRRNLGPGTWELSQFPLRQGLNEIEIELQDSAGTLSRELFYLPYTAGLLAPGLQLWQAQAGVTQDEALQFFSSGYWRLGVHPSLTWGLQAALDADEVLAQTDLLWALFFGQGRFEAALYRDNRPGAVLAWDGALGFDYTFQSAAEPLWPRGGVGLRARGPALRPPRPEVSVSSGAGLQGTLHLSAPLGPGLSASLFGRADWPWDERSASTRWTALVNWRPVPNLGLGLKVQADTSLPWPWSGQISLSWTPGSGQFQAVQEFQGPNALQAGASQSLDPWTQASWSLGLNSDWAQGRLAGWSAQTRLAHLTGELGLSHNGWTEGPESQVQVASGLRFATGVAWADGVFGWSRPLNDSFVLVQARPGYEPYQPVLSGQSGGGSTPIFPWGSGVLGPLRPYRLLEFSADSQALPEGWDLSPGRLNLRLRPFQAGVITLGSERILSARVKLVDPEGAPRALRVFTLRREREFTEQTVFTNREGQAELTGLIPGRYLLQERGGGQASFELPPEAAQSLEPEAFVLEVLP